jgi:protein SCO1
MQLHGAHHGHLGGQSRVPRAVLACGALALAAAPGRASAESDDSVVPTELKHVNVFEHLDGQVPLDVSFKDERGNPVSLAQYFDGKRPVLLTFAYHSCPELCSLVLDGVAASLSNVGLTVGEDFNVLTISIDPHDTLDAANAKRDALLAKYNRPQAAEGWHFLQGDEASIKRIADAVGYEFSYDARDKQYAHPAVIMVLKPNGRVGRYMYGIEYSPKDVKLGLLEAAEGKSIGTVDKVVLYCYRYDPKDGKYVVAATRVMQLGGGATVLVLGALLSMLWLRERGKKESESA